MPSARHPHRTKSLQSRGPERKRARFRVSQASLQDILQIVRDARKSKHVLIQDPSCSCKIWYIQCSGLPGGNLRPYGADVCGASPSRRG